MMWCRKNVWYQYSIDIDLLLAPHLNLSWQQKKNIWWQQCRRNCLWVWMLHIIHSTSKKQLVYLFKACATFSLGDKKSLGKHIFSISDSWPDQAFHLSSRKPASKNKSFVAWFCWALSYIFLNANVLYNSFFDNVLWLTTLVKWDFVACYNLISY